MYEEIVAFICTIALYVIKPRLENYAKIQVKKFIKKIVNPDEANREAQDAFLNQLQLKVFGNESDASNRNLTT